MPFIRKPPTKPAALEQYRKDLDKYTKDLEQYKTDLIDYQDTVIQYEKRLNGAVQELQLCRAQIERQAAEMQTYRAELEAYNVAVRRRRAAGQEGPPPLDYRDHQAQMNEWFIWWGQVAEKLTLVHRYWSSLRMVYLMIVSLTFFARTWFEAPPVYGESMDLRW